MRISFVDVQNFRKLKNCRVELAAKETVFVGSNNSGKASAMDAMIAFHRITLCMRSTIDCAPSKIAEPVTA